MPDTGEVLLRHKLDVDAYHRMAEVGILGPDERVELIDGELIDMAPIGWDHVSIVNDLTEAFVLAGTGRAIVSVQNPLRLGRLDEPEPDLVLFRWRADRYRAEGRPTPADVLLVVEVSGSSLRFDRMVKLPLYARAGIPEVWIVDVSRRVLVSHRRPEGDGYAEETTHGPADQIALAAAPEISLSLAGLFG